MSFFERNKKQDGPPVENASRRVDLGLSSNHVSSGEGGPNMANIGKSISIKGDLSGNEDLVIEGQVEGKVELPSNQLTIGAEGNATAEIHAKQVVIVGKVTGNISATERIEIQSSGFVDGDVRAPRLVVEEGAVINGSISMDGAGTSGSGLPKSDPLPMGGEEKKGLL